MDAQRTDAPRTVDADEARAEKRCAACGGSLADGLARFSPRSREVSCLRCHDAGVAARVRAEIGSEGSIRRVEALAEAAIARRVRRLAGIATARAQTEAAERWASSDVAAAVLRGAADDAVTRLVAAAKPDPALVARAVDEAARALLGRPWIDAATEAAANGASELPDIPALDARYSPPAHAQPIRAALAAGLHLIVAGPSGAGKTYVLAQELARVQRRAVQYGCSLGSSYRSLVVAQGLARDGDATVTRWTWGALPRAMLAGAVLLLDEIDALDPSLAACVYTVLDGSPLYVPELGRSIAPADGFQIAATCNSLGADGDGGYTHAQAALSIALVQRLAVVRAAYDPKAEAAALTVAGYDADAITKAVAFTAKWRATPHAAQHPISLRTLTTALRARTALGLDEAGAWRLALLDAAPASVRADGLTMLEKA